MGPLPVELAFFSHYSHEDHSLMCVLWITKTISVVVSQNGSVGTVAQNLAPKHQRPPESLVYPQANAASSLGLML